MVCSFYGGKIAGLLCKIGDFLMLTEVSLEEKVAVLIEMGGRLRDKLLDESEAGIFGVKGNFWLVF